MHDDAEEADGVLDAGSGAAGATPASQALVTVPLDRRLHRTDQFTCVRSERVQEFFRVDRDHLVQKNYAKVFVISNPVDPGQVWGFYSLSATIVDKNFASTQLQKKIPRGLPVPMALIGYMGRDDQAPKGLGATLLVDAARRISRIADIGIWGIALHAENDDLATKFYLKAGFMRAKQAPGGDPVPRGLMFAPLASLLP